MLVFYCSRRNHKLHCNLLLTTIKHSVPSVLLSAISVDGFLTSVYFFSTGLNLLVTFQLACFYDRNPSFIIVHHVLVFLFAVFNFNFIFLEVCSFSSDCGIQ